MNTIYRLSVPLSFAFAVSFSATPHATAQPERVQNAPTQTGPAQTAPAKPTNQHTKPKPTLSYPCIVGGPVNSDSQLVLRAAKLAFQSNCIDAFNAGAEVRKKMKELVVWPVDESDIAADTTQFTVKKAPGAEGDQSTSGSATPDGMKSDDSKSGDSKSDDSKPGNAAADIPASKFMCVQKTPYLGTRFVVRQKYFNWQGDWFNILLTKSKDTDNEVFNKLDNIEIEPETLPQGYVCVTCNTWQKPWIFRNSTSGKFLAVDTQHPAEAMSDWDVYAPTREGKGKLICKIRFKTPSKNASSLLPKGPLAQIAVLLDKIIGIPKEDEGTMHPTDRLRNEVQKMWGNLLFRPWALSQPDATKAQVDKHLKKWQKGARAFHEQYVQLQALYPQALASLTQYYEQSRGKSHADAQKMAKKNLDIAYRSHFRL